MGWYSFCIGSHVSTINQSEVWSTANWHIATLLGKHVISLRDGAVAHSEPYRCSALARPALRYASDTGDRYPPRSSKSVLNLT